MQSKAGRSFTTARGSEGERFVAGEEVKKAGYRKSEREAASEWGRLAPLCHFIQDIRLRRTMRQNSGVLPAATIPRAVEYGNQNREF